MKSALVATVLASCIALISAQEAFASFKTKAKKTGLVAFSAVTFLPRWGCYLAVVPLAMALEKCDRFIDHHMSKIEHEEEREKLGGIVEDQQS